MKKSRRNQFAPPTPGRRDARRKTMTRSLLLSFLLAAGVVTLAAGGALFSNKTPRAEAAHPAQEEAKGDQSEPLSPAVQKQIAALQEEKRSRTPEQQKIDSQLLYAIKMRRNDPAMAALPTLETGVTANAKGRTVVDITANVSDSYLGQLKANGATIIDSLPQYRSVRAEVSLDALERIAAFSETIFIQPEQQGYVWRNEQKTEDRETRLSKNHFVRTDFADRAARVRARLSSALRAEDEENTPGTNTGSVNSEGDRTHEADRARGAFNVNGSGIKIGVMSDGVRGIAEAQGRGDLPPDVIILPGQAGPAEGAEGTAMLEIVHDLAPGAQLYFATAFGGTARFAQNIRDLRAAGCDIIVDDVFYSFETPIQDGQAPNVISPTNGAIIAQAVIDVTNNGAEYFSSAGNGGNKNDNTSGVWEGDFFDGGPAPAVLGGALSGQVHDFNGTAAGGTFNTITQSSGAQIVLFWSDPLGGSSNDYDLYVTNSAGTGIVASSTGGQTGTQDPIEAVAATANVAGNRIYVVRYDRADTAPPGPPSASRFLHLTTTPNGGGAKLTFNTNGQTKGHNTAALAYGVGATPAFVPYPNPFNSSNVVETFSSDGPRRLFFNADGSPKTPGNFSSTGGEVRQKPDITAADGVMVTGGGGFPPGSTFPFRFFGTSAAAPHAAAIAGLLKSARPGSNHAQVRAAINASAVDIEAPGVDRDSGVGIIMAFGALQASGAPGFANLEQGTTTATEVGGNANGFVEPGERGTLSIQLRNTGLAPATGITATLTSTTPGVIVTAPGTSAYPDIPAGGAATNTTPFEFVITEAAACNATISFTLTVNYTGGPSPKVIPITLLAGPSANVNETLDATPPASNPPRFTATTGTQTNRVARTADVSSCNNNKTNPGPTAVAGALRYDAYTFPNTASTPTCVTISLTTNAGGNLQVVAYSPSFDPANPAANFLGDYGNLITTNRTFSVLVPANQNLVVVVNEASAGGCANCTYNLQVTGLSPPCTAAPANQPPVNTVPGPQATNENTPLVFSAGNGNQISVSDPEAGNNNLQVTLTANNGTISLNGTAGLTFSNGDGTNDVSMTFTGTAASINNALNGLVFTPTHGSIAPASLTITTSDQGLVGSGGPQSDTDTVPITINPGGTIQFSSATYTLAENGSSIFITVTRTGGSAGVATVDYNVSDGTAVEGSDYFAFDRSLTFGDGETTKTFEVVMANDTIAEDNETVNLTLSNVNGSATLGTPSAAVLTIIDDDGLQFGQATYNVQEACTAINVTVTRTGNTAQAARVNYATSDGTASARSDYTAAFGTLDFAAGEISKTVQILINEDSLTEGPETFTVTLSNPGTSPAQTVVGDQSTTTVTITDDATEPSTNAIDDTQTFVCQQYHDFLNREPDAAGLAFWTNNIDSCGTNAACREAKRVDTSAAFFLSGEFQETGYNVYLTYQAAFARTPVPVRFEEFLPDVQRISRGVVIGQPGAAAQLEANKQAYFNEFVTRPAFTTQYPASMTPAQFVDELNNNSGGSLSQSERDALVAQLTANNTPAGRASVLRRVVEDGDFRTSQFNRAFVLMEYFGYLRRNPNDAPDADFSGYFFWLNKLESFNGDFRKAEMVKAFINSAEYRRRFGNS
ncbi:MAG TPA: Calx-beta domain-containing protein [Pyrinomonadaceae bacterium]|nr:Calx-beta domain-containing protein [Pyrinomonadaceae bacterium]